jgi:hypothetical protein
MSAEELERRTDALAAPAYDALSVAERQRLIELLTPIAVLASAQLPYPNAMGVPPP